MIINEHSYIKIKVPHFMDYTIQEHNDNKMALVPLKKNMDKKWEEELREWVVEEFYIPYQAS